jgi:ABC-type transport system involved in Fe-S cluster assembly fused permease/ATPase subunit
LFTTGWLAQRIGIARLLLKKNAEIFFFDEPTSAMDAVTESEITQLMRTLTKGKTTLTIAHRLMTIQNTDRVFALQDGKLREEKRTHQERLAAGGLYATFWNAAQQIRQRPSITALQSANASGELRIS